VNIELAGELRQVGDRLGAQLLEGRDVALDVAVRRAGLLCATSFMAATKSATRVTSVLSISLMFSCAPLRTSCRRMLASRSRSNRRSYRPQHVLRLEDLGHGGGRRLLGLLHGRLGGVGELAQRTRDRFRRACVAISACPQLLDRRVTASLVVSVAVVWVRLQLLSE